MGRAGGTATYQSAESHLRRVLILRPFAPFFLRGGAHFSQFTISYWLRRFLRALACCVSTRLKEFL
jgi:hypothetical protein